MLLCLGLPLQVYGRSVQDDMRESGLGNATEEYSNISELCATLLTSKCFVACLLPLKEYFPTGFEKLYV